MYHINSAILITKWFALIAAANDNVGGDGKRACTQNRFY